MNNLQPACIKWYSFWKWLSCFIKEANVYRNNNEWPKSIYLWICLPGERPFHCETCKRSFSRGDKLQMHLRIHSGVKPHHCDQCDYATVDSGSLRKHMRIHNDERPYKWVHIWYGCIIFLWIKVSAIWFSPCLVEDRCIWCEASHPIHKSLMSDDR